VYVPKWFLLLPVVAFAAVAWREYPAMVRYLRIRSM
jgi:hypothetical protein